MERINGKEKKDGRTGQFVGSNDMRARMPFIKYKMGLRQTTDLASHVG